MKSKEDIGWKGKQQTNMTCIFGHDNPVKVLAVEQISYVSRYTRSRKQLSFCVTVKYTLGFGCAREENKTTTE
jgi:hypothetical protein